MTNIVQLLGEEAEHLLNHRCAGIPKESLHLPGPDYVDRVVAMKDRRTGVLRSLQALYGHGRLANTGYLSLLPVDQGVEHSGGASFAPNPIYFDPENIVKLAIEGGCNGVASTLGVLSSVARRYAHKIPFVVKINHNELLTYPNEFDQTLFASVDQAFDMGAVAVGATVFFGSEQSRRQIQEISEAFEYAHSLGMATFLWAYLRNPAFKTADKDYHVSADLTGQANHLAVTINADIAKQKMAENNGGYNATKIGKTSPKAYSELLYGARRHDQFRRRIRQGRPAPGGAHRGDQQARRRHGADLRAQGVSKTDAGRHRAAQCDSGCVCGKRGDGGVTRQEARP